MKLDYDIKASMAESREALTEDINDFFERLKANGVDDDTAFLVRQRVILEKSKAVKDANDKYAGEIEGYKPINGEYPVGEMLELLARRASGVYAAILSLSEQVGKDDILFEGAAQIAIDLACFAKRVNEGYHADLQVKYSNGKA